MKNRPVRTRFAPSPTGYLHVGGARTALFNYLYARVQKGKFILRIEDTDQERYTPDAEQWILDSLAWLGLPPDEGPETGGPWGPYRQSERLHNYEKYTQKLLEAGFAYPCFCTDEELKSKQEQAKVLGKPYIYDGKCRGLSDREVADRKAAKENYAIRFCTNELGKPREINDVFVEDLVQGKVRFDARLIGDFIIVKSNGFPSYNYAVAIDDHEMQISHVIRGVSHLSNTPRQILIHQALGLELPCYAHISEIVGSDRKKLSKRRGATSIHMFRELGYLPQAFTNYMALLGWYPPDGVEFMPNDQLEKKFELDRCSKSPGMFDFFLVEKNPKETASTEGAQGDVEALDLESIQKNINKKSKLNWLNGLYLRELPLEQLWKEESERVKKDKQLNALLTKDEATIKHGFDCTRKYLNTLSDSLPYLRELFREDIEVCSTEAQEFIDQELSQTVASTFLSLLRDKKPKEPDDFLQLMKEVSEKTGARGRSLYMPIRIAATGSMEGLELPALFSILGHERVSLRLHKTLKISED